MVATKKVHNTTREAKPSDDLLTRIAVLEERMNGAAVALQLQLESSTESLRIQAKEYERRLEELNNVRSESIADRLRFVTTDRYESTTLAWTEWRERFLSEIAAWRAVVNSRLDVMSGRDASKAAIIALILALAGMAIQVYRIVK